MAKSVQKNFSSYGLMITEPFDGNKVFLVIKPIENSVNGPMIADPFVVKILIVSGPLGKVQELWETVRLVNKSTEVFGNTIRNRTEKSVREVGQNANEAAKYCLKTTR